MGTELYAGLFAGLFTSACWTVSSLLFTAAGRRIGPVWVNSLRILMAVPLLFLAHLFLGKQYFPRLLPTQLYALGLSGLLGLTLGDLALFYAFVDIGPRLATLIMATAPLGAALLGSFFLGEDLSGLAWVGITLTLAGVAWVVLERPTRDAEQRPHKMRGVLLALLAAVGQAIGVLLSKYGMGHGWLPPAAHLSPLATAFVRMSVAGITTIPLLLVLRSQGPKKTFSPEDQRRGLSAVFFGAILGPFTGMWLSLVAADRLPLGVAQTLISLTPIMILPFVARFEKERISPRAVLGALLAVAGVSLLFWA